MRLFQTATCFLKFEKSPAFRAVGLSRLQVVVLLFVDFYLLKSLALGSSCTMTKRDSSFAGITYPSSSMSMPRRLSWRSRDHGQSSSTAAPSDSLHPSRSDTAPTAPKAGPPISPTVLQDQVSTHLTTGTLRQTLPHPYQLLPIIRLQFSLILQEKPIHSSTRWQKSDVSSMPTTLSRSNHLQMTTPNRHFADLW